MSTDRASGNQSTGSIEADVLDRLDKLEAENERLRETVENQQTRIDELEDRVDSAEKSRGHIIEDLVELESEIEESRSIGSDSEKGGGKAGENQPSAENIGKISPLGQVVNVPEPEVDQHIQFENQKRARFIAKDIRQYADMRKGELVVSSGDIKKILSAKEERSIHWQTVGRVVDFLDELGKGDVTVKDKRGTIVCFDPDAVAQWERGQVTPVVSGQIGTV
jgi:septal ring factor EnvC (AmiA/AmiB activator)